MKRLALFALLLIAAGLQSPSTTAEPPALEDYDPARRLSDEERAVRVDQVRSGMTADQVRHWLGPPKRSARQVLYHRYFEQWVYDAPFNLCVEFECRHGQKAQVQSVQATQTGGP